MNWFKSIFSKSSQEGQSLVELALFLPVAMMLIVGVVEISQLLITHNRVETAANVATRFGANGGDDDGMSVSALRSISQTLPIDTGRWDIWTVRGKLNEQGTGIEESSWKFQHVYGDGLTQEFSQVNEAELREEVYNDLLRSNPQDEAEQFQTVGADTEFVGTIAMHDAQSILGLDFFLEDVFSVRALNVMRGFPTSSATNGCTAFPIAVEEGVRSLGGSSSSTFPASNEFTYPPAGPDQPTILDFPDNVPDVPLRQAKPGYVYRIQNGAGSGNFGWIKWNEYVSGSAANTLAASLGWPGNSTTYDDSGSGSTPPGYDHPVSGFLEVGDPTDSTIHIGDRVAGHTGSVNSNAVRETLIEHVRRGRTLRVIVWTNEDGGSGGSGSNVWYKMSGFVVMRIHGFNLSQSGSGSWILGEVVQWDTSCGQVNQLSGGTP